MMWTQLFSRRNVLGFLAVLMVLPLGCTKEEPAAEEEEEHAAPVKWEAAEKADLEEWTELLGIAQPLPSHVAHISAPLGGYVLSVLPADHGKAIVEGQRVEKGQILVQLDERILRANREKLLVSDPELQEQIKQAGHAHELARLEVERLESLLKSSGTSVMLVTHVEMDKVRLALKDAESKLKGVKAKEEVARAELKVIDEQINQYTMRAPIAGQLGMVHAYPGQTLAAGASVAEVINLDEIDVLCFVPASIVNRLQLDQVVRIEEKEEALTDAVRLEQGHIIFISDQAQAETGTIAVKARFPNQHRKLRGNTLVRVRVLTEKKSDCITLPEAALLEDQEDTAVLIVETEKKKDKEGNVIKDKDGKEEEEHHVRKLVAKLGLRDRDKHRVEIIGLFEVEEEKKKPVPLEKDTLFVVEGGHGLEDKDLVTEKKEEHEEEKKDEKKEEK
ncbi:MAG TPA: efflux RND transporter periplasmic adaptor subunit [Gemmataceae bacterium]|nr:efflux RND transporter periplasmic adaptor subunit [Gemmataceae bacterium]